MRRRSFAASAALHGAIVLGLLLLLRPSPLPEEPVVTVRLLQDGPGAAGAAGGDGGGGGEATVSRSASPEAQAQPQVAESIENTPEEATAEAPPSPAPPQESPPSRTVAALALETSPPPPRHKPRPPHPHPTRTATATPPSEAPSETTREEPVEIAAAPATTPTPGTPGAGSGPGATSGLGTGAQGAGHGAIGNGPLNGPGDDYLDRLKRWINRFKHYPKDALNKKQEGRLVVSFIILRDGTVLDPRIEHSSGVPSLDEAAIEMLRAASPVPPLPESYRGERASLDLPVGYSIGLFDKLF